MEKLLIYFNEKKFKSDVESLETFVGMCNTVIDKFNSLDIGKFQPKEFSKLFFNTEEFLFEKTMDGRPLEVGGMKVNKRKMYDLLEKPGYDNLLSEVVKIYNSVKFRQREVKPEKSPQIYLSFLMFDEKNQLKVDAEIIEDLREKNCTYVSNEKSKLAFKLANEIRDILNKGKAFEKLDTIHSPQNLGVFINKLIEVDYETQECTVNLAGIQFFER